MTKTLEERKAYSKAWLDNLHDTCVDYLIPDGIDKDKFIKNIIYILDCPQQREAEKTITELLQPTPPDDEVEEVLALRDLPDTVICFDWIMKYFEWVKNDDDHLIINKIRNTLIRRATQPKSCDGLVEALEKIIYETTDDGDGVTGSPLYIQNVAKQALAEHRKGDV